MASEQCRRKYLPAPCTEQKKNRPLTIPEAPQAPFSTSALCWHLCRPQSTPRRQLMTYTQPCSSSTGGTARTRESLPRTPVAPALRCSRMLGLGHRALGHAFNPAFEKKTRPPEPEGGREWPARRLSASISPFLREDHHYSVFLRRAIAPPVYRLVQRVISHAPPHLRRFVSAMVTHGNVGSITVLR